MKTIIYSLVAIILFGMVAKGFSYKPNNTHKILIQSNESKMDASSLSRSVDIISARLKNFSTGKFDVKSVGSNRIQVEFDSDQDLKLLENLISRKGVVEFYETWNYKDFSQIRHNDTLLLSLMKAKAPGEHAANLGCTTASRVKQVNDYLKSTGLDRQCKFAWNDLFDNAEVCLYVLKPNPGILLKGPDIESCTAKYDSAGKYEYIDLRFKKPVVGLWAAITKRNINQSIAILLDSKVIVAPTVRSEINGGNCQITGDFSRTQVQYIAAMMGNGELPVSFELIK
jgi:preprotein translocase subunit SecD